MILLLLFSVFGLLAALLPVLLIPMPPLAAAAVFLLCFVLGYVLAAVLWLLALWFITGGKQDFSKPRESLSPLTRRGARALGEMLCFFGGVRLHLSGEDKLPGGRFLFVCNHRSLFDPLVVMGPCGHWDVAFISKPSNLKIPLVGDLAYTAGFLPIDRDNDRKALRSILAAADYMKRDLCSMGIYPEGTRNRQPGGELLPFHAGSFKTAQRAGVPVAVCCIRGTEKIARRLGRRNDVYLDVLAVFDAERVHAMSTAQLADTARELIRQKLAEEA